MSACSGRAGDIAGALNQNKPFDGGAAQHYWAASDIFFQPIKSKFGIWFKLWRVDMDDDENESV
jgi:hypothetical protein